MAHLRSGHLAACAFAGMTVLCRAPAIPAAPPSAPLVVLGGQSTARTNGTACAVIQAAAADGLGVPEEVRCTNIGTQSSIPERALRSVRGHTYTAPQFNTVSTLATGETLLNFDASDGSTSRALDVSIPELLPGESVAVILQWSTSTGAAASQLDLCVSGADVTDRDGKSAVCTGANSASDEPVRVLVVGNAADASGDTRAQKISVQVGLVAGAIPQRIRVAVADDGAGAFIGAPSAADEVPRHIKQGDQAGVQVTLDLSPTTIDVGQSATLTWTTQNADSCTASGAWSGNQPFSGSMMVSPPSANSYTYTLGCTNSDSVASESQTLTVMSSGGGGNLDLLALLALAGVAGARVCGRRRV